MRPGREQGGREWKPAFPKGDLDLVFPNGVGNVGTHSNIYNRIFKPLMLTCGIVDGEGIPRFSLHAMRHAAASLFIERGWPPKRIQGMLGHSSITMTYDVYGHLFHTLPGRRPHGGDGAGAAGCLSEEPGQECVAFQAPIEPRYTSRRSNPCASSQPAATVARMPLAHMSV